MIKLPMPVFSTFIPEIHHNVSPGFVDVLIRTQREELFTGLMQLRYPPNENLILAFVEGTEQQLYRCNENTTEIIPHSTWHQTMDHPEAVVGLLGLSLEAMRVIRVAHEAPVVRVEHLVLKPQELLEHAGKWSLDAEPSIIQIHGEQVEHVHLFANCTGATVETVSFAGGKVHYSISDSFSVPDTSKGEFQVVRYASTHDHPIWQEYELRLTFNPFVRMLMSRFNELAGRTLTERLGEQLTTWARGGGWNITLNSNGVIDHHYFDVLSETANAYMDILRRFQDEASPAIGSRLADGISREILSKLDVPRRELLLQHIFTKQGPGSATARA